MKEISGPPPPPDPQAGGEARRPVLAVIFFAVVLGLAIRSPWTGFLVRRASQFGRPAAPHRGPSVLTAPPSAGFATSTELSQTASAPQLFEPLPAAEAQRINAETPFYAGRLLPLPGLDLSRIASDQDLALARRCLTLAVYYEAAGEGPGGEAAVAQVVLNRLRHPLFPKTVCGVVFQGSQLPTGCQFTFTCDGSLARAPDAKGWMQAQSVADRALSGYQDVRVGSATHYHTAYVLPYWRTKLLKLTQLGAHIFYRWPGTAGMPSSFTGRYAGGETLAGATGGAPPPIILPPSPTAATVVVTPAPSAAPAPVAPDLRSAQAVPLTTTPAPPPPAIGPLADAASPAGSPGAAKPNSPQPVRPPGAPQSRLAMPRGW